MKIVISIHTLLIVLLLMLVGCTQLTLLPAGTTPLQNISVSITQTPLKEAVAPCEDSFIAHSLDHTTTINGDIVYLYDSNGSGLGVNDLDNDGDLDLVLGNLAGANAILWNEGELIFSKQELSFGRTRAINIVDFDGDGWQDILFARQQKRPTLWRNLGLQEGAAPATRPTFEELFNPGIWVKAFTTSWADLDVDGDLDLVAASYDTEYTRGNPGAAGGGGVAVFQNQGDGRGYESTSLAFETQALALMLEDINRDNAIDILVGNDFFLQDLVWLQQGSDWQKMEPFSTMSMNTMSYASADLDNDGQAELFAGDMLPYQPTDEILAKWAPVVQHIEMIPNDPQVMANVVHSFDSQGWPTDQAPLLGVKAAGWSWSAQFGDLDNDGLLDLYIVNGMNAEELFGHLPGNELIEENLVFRNTSDGRFVPVPEWGLSSTLGGRSMSMADMDQDGDLDIVVNNLLGTTQLFENRLCGGASLLVDLHDNQSKNTRAIGAKLTLHTTTGTYYRTVHAASGYLSGVPAQIHFGFPAQAAVERLEITWPDGAESTIESLSSRVHVKVTR